VKVLHAFAYAVGRALVLFILAIWFIAACAGAYVALWFFWPLLASAGVVVWAVCRAAGWGKPEMASVSIEPRRGRLRRLRVAGSHRPMRRQILASIDPAFSVELAPSRWLEAATLLLCAPFLLQGPIFVAASLLVEAAREEPQFVIEWSWLPIGAVLVAGQAVSLVAFVWYAGRQFVGPATIGRRLNIPLSGRALCVAHRDVCAVDIQCGAELAEHISVHVVRFIRTRGESVEVALGDEALAGAPPSAELLALTKFLARTARVPLRPTSCTVELGTRVSTT
jgi:hypothetical protein